MSSPLWIVPPVWSGETCFIVGGGVSVETQPVERLRGHKVIALNSSYERVPFADYLLFADTRWYRVHESRPAFRAFTGQLVTCSPHVDDPRVWRLRRMNPPGLAQELDTVVMRRTVMAAAMNLATHLGVARIVALGLDGKETDGRSHHHEPHPWPQKEGCWGEQQDDLADLVVPLAERGIVVVNASPGTAVDLWPVTTLERELSVERGRFPTGRQRASAG
jgi:hypothetical protein